VDCLEFRRLAGADPQHPDAAVLEHAAGCPRCAGYLRQTLELDRHILAALSVPVPLVAGRAKSAAASVSGLDRRRWYALAASIVAGVLVGSLLWVGGPRNSLAQDVLAHMDHEPEAFVVTTTPADDAVLGRVLERGGIRLRPEVGTVSYANSCRFRGRTVPHLVVQTDGGPVTVMVLRNEPLDAPVRFAEDRFTGTIVPAGPGSIAVIGGSGADLEQITERVIAAVDWRQD
jgi:Protein of unknown function (DUF3379)